MTRAALFSSRVLAPAPPPPNPTAIDRYTGGATEGPQGSLPRYSMVDLSAYRTSDLAWLRTHAPGVRVIVYKNPIAARDNSEGNPTPITSNNPVNYDEAIAHDNAQPPTGTRDLWLMRDVNGAVMGDKNYLPDKLVNLGSVSFQNQAKANLLATLQNPTPDWDGVYLDNTNPNYLSRTVGGPSNPTQGYVTPPAGGSLASLSDAGWKTNYIAYHASVCNALKTAGYHVHGNAGVSSDPSGSIAREWWTHINSYFSSVEEEFFAQEAADLALDYNDLTDFHGHYDAVITSVGAAQDLGLDFWGRGHGTATDTAKMMYVKAAFLLGWNGVGGGMFWTQSTGSEPWNTAWTTQIGIPDVNDGHGGVKFAVGTGWRRNYTGGTVIVNPNKPTGTNIVFPLGANYRQPDGTVVSSVTLNPVTAMILTTP